MNDNRLKNLYEALCSTIIYGNYIESYNMDDIDFSFINFDQLICLFISVYITTSLDPLIIKKSDKSFTLDVVPEFADILAQIISKKLDVGYQVGNDSNNLKYHDAITLIVKIRNKMAHGDYIVENGNFIFEESGAKGIISIDNLIEFIKKLFVDLRDNKLNGIATMYACKAGSSSNYKVSSENSFSKICEQIEILSISDIPKKGYHRNKTYVDNIKCFKNNLADLFEFFKIDDELFNLKKYLPFFNFVNANVKIDYTNVYQSPYYENIKNEYLMNIKNNLNYEGEMLVNIILDKYIKLSKGEFQSYSFLKGILFSLKILNFFKNNPNVNLKDYINSNMAKEYLLYIDDAVLATYLVGFNAFYQYGLEDGLTTKGNYDLYNLVSNKSFDFSLLDLSCFEDPNMVIEHKFDSYEKDYDKYYSKATDALKRKNNIINIFDQYLNHIPSDKIDLDKVHDFRNKINEDEKEYYDNLDKAEEISEFKKNFNKDLYVKNLNIIEHIRNAFAHGTVKIDETCVCENILDKFMIIEDIYEGTITYSVKIKVGDFTSLFKIKNFNILLNYIYNNVSDIDIIDTKYIDKINEICQSKNNTK